MNTMPRRATLMLSALIAVLLWTPTSASAQQGPGVHVTRNGFRTHLYGISQMHDADGNAAATCAALTAPQVEAARFDRRVSRAMVASSPKTVVRGPEGGATFEVTYTDAEGAGFKDAAAGATRRRAFETALSVWTKAIKAEQTIKVAAAMHEMDDGDNDPLTTLLATAGPTEFWIIENKVVPSPLAWQLIGGRYDNAGPTDITVNVNDRAQWDYALNGQPAEGKHSFVFTLMHEIGHGLGLVDSFDHTTGKLLNDPFPFVYDVFVNRGSSARNLAIDHAPEEKIRDLKSGDLFFNGENAGEASRASRKPLPMLKLYAPDPYRPGASVAHLDQDTYAELRTILMTPLIVAGSDKIDSLTLAMIKDIGYQLVPVPVTTTQ